MDGLLVAPTTTGDDGRGAGALAAGRPTCPWCSSSAPPPSGPYHEAMESVVSDHALGAGMAVRHLAELGHRRIGLITT